MRASTLDWTIVRPGFLNDGPFAGRYRIVHELTGVRSGSLSRADVGHYLVAAVEQGMDVGATVLLSD